MKKWKLGLILTTLKPSFQNFVKLLLPLSGSEFNNISVFLVPDYIWVINILLRGLDVIIPK